MIPPFDNAGNLPPGIHAATLDEIETRFGQQSELRRVQMESVRWLVDLARRAGIDRVVLNGSFTTDTIEPNDVDCALLIGESYPRESAAADDLEKGLPFLEILALEQAGFDRLVNAFFATDRDNISKGMIEVVL